MTDLIVALQAAHWQRLKRLVLDSGRRRAVAAATCSWGITIALKVGARNENAIVDNHWPALLLDTLALD